MTDFKTMISNFIAGLAKPQALGEFPSKELDTPRMMMTAVPDGMRQVDLSGLYEAAATKLQPWRRTGTAKMQDLQSLIDWANRNKGETSALFATVSDAPSLTCIADYMAAGSPVLDHHSRDPAASHCRHRAHYAFPLSREWKLWTAISGKAMEKAELGNFVEENAKDFLAPSPALVNGGGKLEDWEKAFELIAQQVRGRFGSVDALITLSRQFEVNETMNLKATRNPDTGESSFVFINEHQQPDGNPIQIPTLFIIALPVFENGHFYRLAVRFRYQKQGSALRFFLTLHNPDIAMRDAVEGALDTATTETGLPLFRGQPEAA
ncbi:DUF2303 family protein [Gemmobacter sp. LW-1]|uniref:DUF2303 family protein n=1 Tax=Gemmobacter sp. LW-1 TaxID=1529005 RepID=UPI000AB2D0A2|nr:DUF2303 family protein [Gemmobacter sp. LW-1]